jgi:hypothetical protein
MSEQLTREEVLFRALHKIATWPDNGNQYGQKNIKRFAREQLAYSASFDPIKPAAGTYPPCTGMNCGATDGVSHSPECRAEHAAAAAGGKFVKRS